MYTILMVVQVLVAVALIGLVLLQQGKGADAGAAFGSGASSTVFGSRGSANFLSRTTGWLAAAFFGVSLALAYLINDASAPTQSVVDTMQKAEQAAPEATVPPVEGQPAVAPAAAPAEQTPKVPE